MAIARDRILIDSIRNSARTLGIASTWVNSRRPLQLEEDFVYELYVMFEFVNDLRNTYGVRYHPGSGNKRHQFPRKPAQKRGRPKFYIIDRRNNNTLWQLCAGTKITDIVQVMRAPDISVQKHNASDDPIYSDVVMIWDAKYRSNNMNRITHHEFSDFSRLIELFRLRRRSILGSMNIITLRGMVANCIVTNGQESTEPVAECLRVSLKEVTSFYPGILFNIKP